MKTGISLLISLFLLANCVSFGNEEVSGSDKRSQAATSNVYSSVELNGLVSVWASAYNKQMPDRQIDLIMLPGNQTGLSTEKNLAFISGNEIEGADAGWKMVVGREVIVPVVNSANPFLKELNEKGVSRQAISQLVQDKEKMVWGTLVGNGQMNPVHLYISSDNTVRNAVEKYLGIAELTNTLIINASEEELIAALKNDPYAVGFCKMTSMMGLLQQKDALAVQLMPLDKNGNGKLDNMEKIYDDLDVFARGVWIGKYPKALSNEIYAVSFAQPSDETQVAFLSWVLTDGQQFLALNGFSGLVYSEVQSKLEQFSNADAIMPAAGKALSIPKLVLFIILAALALSIMIGAIIGFGRSEKAEAEDMEIDYKPAFNEHSLAAPKGLYYDKSHTWAFMEKDGAVRIGLDDFLQHLTGPITRIEMKKPGEMISKGELLVAIIQKGKQLNLYAPVSGRIQERNNLLSNNASLLNTSPYADGWIYKIEPENWQKEITQLSMAGKYTKWITEEIARLKDFLAKSFKSHELDYAHVVLQDGGMLKNNLLEDFGPEVWEDFQTNFLDTNR